jgi:hypothetical protein
MFVPMANARLQSIYHQQMHSWLHQVSSPTVSPLDSVVDSVFTPFFTTGVANPLLNGATVLRAARLRSPWERLRANRRDAMEGICEVNERWS